MKLLIILKKIFYFKEKVDISMPEGDPHKKEP